MIHLPCTPTTCGIHTYKTTEKAPTNLQLYLYTYLYIQNTTNLELQHQLRRVRVNKSGNDADNHGRLGLDRRAARGDAHETAEDAAVGGRAVPVAPAVVAQQGVSDGAEGTRDGGNYHNLGGPIGAPVGQGEGADT